jgi:hypothetical protein
MANNYLQFSEELISLTDAEVAWLRQQLEPVYVFGGREFTKGDLPADLSPDAADRTCLRAYRDLPQDECDDEIGFEFAFLQNEELGQHLWLYAEESGRPDLVAHLIQMFLRQFRPDACWALTYATTCSKPRISEFGGGAVFVTAEAIDCFEIGDFVTQRHAAFLAR